MSKIDQVHLWAVMLSMSKTSKIANIFNIHRIWWYGWKAQSLSFPKLFQIENPLNIKEVMGKNMFAFDQLFIFITIFDTFDMKVIT